LLSNLTTTTEIKRRLCKADDIFNEFEVIQNAIEDLKDTDAEQAEQRAFFMLFLGK